MGAKYEYKTRFELGGPYPHPLSREFVKAIESVARGQEVRIADFGAGSGRTIDNLPDGYELEYYGYELNGDAIANAKSKANERSDVQSKFLQTDLGELVSFGKIEGAVDLVVSSRVAHALQSPETVSQFLQNAHRILRPGGRLVITVGSVDDWKHKAYVEQNGRPSEYLVNYASVMGLPELGIDDFWIHQFSRKEFSGYLSRAGFHVDNSFGYDDVSGYTHLKQEGRMPHYEAFVATKAGQGNTGVLSRFLSGR